MSTTRQFQMFRTHDEIQRLHVRRLPPLPDLLKPSPTPFIAFSTKTRAEKKSEVTRERIEDAVYARVANVERWQNG